MEFEAKGGPPYGWFGGLKLGAMEGPPCTSLFPGMKLVLLAGGIAPFGPNGGPREKGCSETEGRMRGGPGMNCGVPGAD